MTNEHERGVEAATDILLLRAHELSARELAERAIAAYIEAVGFDSAPVLLSRIEELETQLVLSKPLYSRRQLEAKLAEAVKVIEPFAQIADMEEQAGPIASVIVNVARCRDARSFLQSLSKPGVSDD